LRTGGEKLGRLTISSGCKGFLLIDAIDAIDKESIRGRRVFHHDSIYLCIEALAQLGAMHVRVVNDFRKHAFLLKINRFEPSAVSTLCGTYILTGKCVSQSNRAFVYALAATGDSGEHISGEFMFALVDYDTNFKQDLLTRHYRRLFSCLQTDSKTA
jgi:hypothetical protein